MVTISFLVRWAEILSVSHLPLPPDNVNKIKTVLLIENRIHKNPVKIED
jgi:hypothetical protein